MQLLIQKLIMHVLLPIFYDHTYDILEPCAQRKLEIVSAEDIYMAL